MTTERVFSLKRDITWTRLKTPDPVWFAYECDTRYEEMEKRILWYMLPIIHEYGGKAIIEFERSREDLDFVRLRVRGKVSSIDE